MTIIWCCCTISRRRRYRRPVGVVGGAEVLLHPALGADLDGVVGVAIEVGDGAALRGPVAGDGVVDEASVLSGDRRTVVAPALGYHAVEQRTVIADVGTAALRRELIFLDGIAPHNHAVLGGAAIDEQSAAGGGGEAVAHHAAVQGAVHRGDAVGARAGDDGAPGGVLPVLVGAGPPPQRGVGAGGGGHEPSHHGHAGGDGELGGGVVGAGFHEDGAVGARRRDARRDGLLRSLPCGAVAVVIGGGRGDEDRGLGGNTTPNRQQNHNKSYYIFHRYNFSE